jgi:hypothetical protein
MLINEEIDKILSTHQSIAISEDFFAYKEANFDQRLGKLLMVDQADYATQHIFFDDNANEEAKCIVDVRDLISGDPIPYRKFINMYVFKVEPIRAVLEPDYFVKLIEQAVMTRDEEIQREETGIVDEQDYGEGWRQKEKSETEWEKLQKMSDGDYLMKTVLPVLYEGMQVLDLERPNVPIEYLAMYLLKN